MRLYRSPARGPFGVIGTNVGTREGDRGITQVSYRVDGDGFVAVPQSPFTELVPCPDPERPAIKGEASTPPEANDRFGPLH